MISNVKRRDGGLLVFLNKFLLYRQLINELSLTDACFNFLTAFMSGDSQTLWVDGQTRPSIYLPHQAFAIAEE